MEEVNKTYSRRKNCGQVTCGTENRNNDKQEEEEEVTERERDYIKRGHCESKRGHENEVEGGVIHDVCP